MAPLTVEELLEFEPSIQAVAKHMKIQRDSARISEQELAQLIRINVWLYGKSFNEKHRPGKNPKKAMENWLMQIGKNCMLKEIRGRKTMDLLPRDAKHEETPTKKLEQHEAEADHARTYLMLLQILSHRMKNLTFEQREIAQRLIGGQNALQIYREYLAPLAKTKASTRGHEKVRASREVRKVIRTLFQGPRSRRK